MMKLKSPYSKFQVIKYFLRPYPFRVLLLAGLILGYAVLEAASLAVLYTLLNATVGSQSGVAKDIFGFSVADFTRHIPISDPVIATCLLLVIIIAVKNIIGYSSQVFGYFNGYRVWGDVQEKIFEKNIRSEYLPFLETKQGEVVYQTYTAPSYLGSVLLQKNIMRRPSLYLCIQA
jgi:hypothetical protein